MENFAKNIAQIKKNPNQSYIIVIDGDKTIDDFLRELKKELGILENDFNITEIIAGKKIKIEEIRKILQKIYLTPCGNIKLTVIKGADLLTNDAANRLLKIIEEPPKKSLILLFTQNCDKIISTIVSRSVKIILRSNKDHQIDEENKNFLLKIQKEKTLAKKFQIIGEIIADEEMDYKKLLLDWSIVLRNCGNLNQYRTVYKYLRIYNQGINKKLFLENLILELL